MMYRGALRIDRVKDRTPKSPPEFTVTFSPEKPARIHGGATTIVHRNDENDLKRLLQTLGIREYTLDKDGHASIGDLTFQEDVLLQTGLLVQ